MSTRGAYGFRSGGKDYVSYNRSNSYPDYLGEEILKQCKELLKGGMDKLKKSIFSIRLVREKKKPTKTDIKNLKPYTELSVGARETSDWYCLTRGLQGNLIKNIQSGYMMDSANFLLDSIWCEWAYIINLDDNIFEIYKGFVKSKGIGRYDCIKIDEEKDEYYGVKLMATFPLDKINELQSVVGLLNSLGIIE